MHRRTAGSSRPGPEGQSITRTRAQASSSFLRTGGTQNKQKPTTSSSREATPSLPASSSSSHSRESAIQVFVRCAPLSATLDPRDPQGGECITCEPTKSTELILSSASNPSTSPTSLLIGSSGAAAAKADENDRLYTYDSVFGCRADQQMLFSATVQPLLDKILDGFNCTVFAYGATGTGKTFTMQGDLTPSMVGNFSPEAGLIPRVLYRLFDRLENKECDVKISYLELYNEELRDLNSSSSGSGDPPKIFDDSSKKGGVVVNNIEESHVLNAQQGLKVLHRGAAKRQVAATQCNQQSSRSHTVFTITVSVTSQGTGSSSGPASTSEETVKVGKLCLVDLAGSENVGRSGAGRADGRAREAGLINQSLLTLGRVINALVEKSTHIPYRESKLTRILQDSLGGRTQTCIIATVSPSFAAFEETQSTLDYALRAKSITNRPESNARLTRHALLNSYSAEIERLRLDLTATREKSGIYLSPESWEEVQSAQERKRVELESCKRQVETLDMNLRTMSEQFEHSLKLLGLKESEIRALAEERDAATGKVQGLQADVNTLTDKLERRKVQLAQTDQKRQMWKRWADQAIKDVDALRSKLEREDENYVANASSLAQVQRMVGSLTSQLEHNLGEIATTQTQYMQSLQRSLDNLSAKARSTSSEANQVAQSRVAVLNEGTDACVEDLNKLQTAHSKAESFAKSFYSNLQSTFLGEIDRLQEERRVVDQTVKEMSIEMLDNHHKVAKDAQDVLQAGGYGSDHWASERNELVQQIEAEKQRLKDQEISRLKGENEHLKTLVNSLRQNQSDFQQSFLSSISSQLAGFCNNQTRIVRDSVGTARQLSTTHHAERQRDFDHIYDLHNTVLCRERDALDQSTTALRDASSLMETSIHQNYWPRVTALHDESDAVTARLSSTVSNLMSQRSDTLLQHLQEDSENVNNRTQQLQGHLATLRQAQSTTAFDMATSVSNMCQGLEVQSTSLAEETSRHQLHSAQLIQDGVEGSSQISSHVGQSLQLQETHASGHTPEKRSWPTFQDSEARPSKRKRQAGTTPSGSPVKLANVSPNKPPASTSKHVMPASKSTKSGLTVFSDKSNAFATEKSSALDAIIDANLRKPKTISSTSSEAPNRSPIKSFR